MDDLICAAINSRRLLRFYYAGGSAPGFRTVEPHAFGANRKREPALQAWFRAGESASREGEGWREYLLEHVSQVEALEEAFDGPRPGYRAGGGKNFTRVVCEMG